MTSSGGLVRMVLLCVTVAVAACARTPAPPSDELDLVAGQYVGLVEELIRRDPDSASGDTATSDHASDADTQSRAVDQPRSFDQPRTFDQPPTFDQPRTLDQPRFNRPRASKQPRALTDVAAEARAAAGILRRSSTMTAALASPRELDRSPESDQGDGAVARRAWLVAQLDAVAARAAQQAGERIAFDQELLRLFGVARPVPPELSRIRNRLDRLLPGRGSAALRLAAFEERVSVSARQAAPGVRTGARGVSIAHVVAYDHARGRARDGGVRDRAALERLQHLYRGGTERGRGEHGVSAHSRSHRSASLP